MVLSFSLAFAVLLAELAAVITQSEGRCELGGEDSADGDCEEDPPTLVQELDAGLKAFSVQGGLLVSAFVLAFVVLHAGLSL